MMLSETSPSSLTASQQTLAAQSDAESFNAGHHGLSVALSGVFLSFAGVGALTDILLQAGPSQLLASIGPNGASKLRCQHFRVRRGWHLPCWQMRLPAAGPKVKD